MDQILGRNEPEVAGKEVTVLFGELLDDAGELFNRDDLALSFSSRRGLPGSGLQNRAAGPLRSEVPSGTEPGPIVFWILPPSGSLS